MTTKVRLTMNPEAEVEVSETELVDLKRWGLVVDSDEAVAAPEVTEDDSPERPEVPVVEAPKVAKATTSKGV